MRKAMTGSADNVSRDRSGGQRVRRFGGGRNVNAKRQGTRNAEVVGECRQQQYGDYEGGEEMTDVERGGDREPGKVCHKGRWRRQGHDDREECEASFHESAPPFAVGMPTRS